MPSIRGFAVFLCAAAVVCAQSPSRKQLTARELFYAATQAPAKTAEAPKPPAKSDTPRTPAKSAQTARSTKTPPKPVEIARADPQTAPTGGVKVIPAASQTAPLPANGQPPLGLRINVLRFNPDGSTTDVLPETVFHSGDRIQLRVEPNAPGYLYIASQGATGTWKPLFPSSEIAGGDNRAEAMRSYIMPPYNSAAAKPRVFTFDSTAGAEKLFVVFSRQPAADFEDLIYTLQKGKPAPDSQTRSDKTLVMAVNIGNPTIDRLRSAYGRDLIVETVNDAPAGEKRDTAIYVVNPTGSSDSRVVADIHLVHQ